MKSCRAQDIPARFTVRRCSLIPSSLPTQVIRGAGCPARRSSGISDPSVHRAAPHQRGRAGKWAWEGVGVAV
ncbi:hypothetical protein E2C01_070322 [Portunus trituberculatus]|uniref:Uncharacterized protein n=1 Tax=Portunus trituberculatus TaxID=210409 RepID=A0A5B7HX01_PORTR|nr:hypothetical protein [Portunus trituberculatus]